MITEIKNYKSLSYVLTYPDGLKKTGKYPVIIFLHGAGTRGNDINKLKNNAFYDAVKSNTDFDFITAAPQCSADTWFDIFSEISDFAEYIACLDYADRNRIYGIGASMGGYGLWQLAMSKPNLFAAIVPICGGGMYWNAARLKNTPIWAFHGDGDSTVDKSESIKMVDAVNKAGGNAILTIYPDCGHDAWTMTYSAPKVYEWLKQQKRLCRENGETKLFDSKIYG